MDRPTRDEFDEAYGHAETLSEMIADGSRTEQSILPSEMNLLTLAAEVRALRDDAGRALDQYENVSKQLARKTAEVVLQRSSLDAWVELEADFQRRYADLEAENARLRAELDALKASVAAGT